MTSKAASSAHHTILSLSVSGGFLEGLKFEFVDGLNCIIGGRGTGKTTALELLRFGLDLLPKPGGDPDRRKFLEKLMKMNLLNGRVSVNVRTKTGLRYSANRAMGEALQVTNEAGEGVPVSFGNDTIFAADIFSQHEIEDMATSPPAQLALLDRFLEPDASAMEQQLEDLARQTAQTATELRRYDREIEDLTATASEVGVLEERLKSLAPPEGPDGKAMSSAQGFKNLRAREALVGQQLSKAIKAAVDSAVNAASTFKATLDAQLSADLRSGPNKDLVAMIESDMLAFHAALEAAGASITQAANGAEPRIRLHVAELQNRHAKQEAEYRLLLEALEKEGGKAIERNEIQARLVAATAAEKEVNARATLRAAVADKRSALLRQASELRDKRYALRKAVAESLTKRLDGHIRVSVEQAGSQTRYQELLADALKGAGLEQVVAAERISAALLPEELVAAVTSRDVKAIAATGFDEARSARIIDALASEGRCYDIEAIDLDDVPHIELLDGDKYKDSANLSTGQRCTTILPLLLEQSARPLLVDQPEDNLDNKFIYDTVVKAVRNSKGARQIIFVTHNPNIPVLGDAERVFVLESDGQRAKVKRVGTVEECKSEIETILEGGRDAFLKRKERYGH